MRTSKPGRKSATRRLQRTSAESGIAALDRVDVLAELLDLEIELGHAHATGEEVGLAAQLDAAGRHVLVPELAHRTRA